MRDYQHWAQDPTVALEQLRAEFPDWHIDYVPPGHRPRGLYRAYRSWGGGKGISRVEMRLPAAVAAGLVAYEASGLQFDERAAS
jgi:hypothetical protein